MNGSYAADFRAQTEAAEDALTSGLDVQHEAAAFWRMRRRTVRTMLRQTLRNSRLRLSLVIGLSLFFWVGLFWPSSSG